MGNQKLDTYWPRNGVNNIYDLGYDIYMYISYTTDVGGGVGGIM